MGEFRWILFNRVTCGAFATEKSIGTIRKMENSSLSVVYSSASSKVLLWFS